MSAVGLGSIALLIASCLAGDDATPVALPHDWKAGTRYHVDLTRTREDFENEKLVEASSNQTPIDVEVLARRDDGYTVRWTFGKPETAPDEDITEALARKIAALVEGLKLDFVTDATGSVTKLVDPAALEAHFAATTGKLIAELKAAQADERELEAVRSAAASLQGASFRTAYQQIPTRFYMPSGAVLVRGQKRAYADHLPNPFGGEPLPSQAWLELREVNRDRHEARVEWRQSIDPARAGPILEASIRAFAKESGQELPAGARLRFDAIEDAATYVYDLDSGIPRNVVCTRTTVMGGTRRIDTLRYVVTPSQAK